jgi:hypothetical protein
VLPQGLVQVPIRLTFPMTMGMTGSPVVLQALPPGFKPGAGQPTVLDLRQPQGVIS